MMEEQSPGWRYSRAMIEGVVVTMILGATVNMAILTTNIQLYSG